MGNLCSARFWPHRRHPLYKRSKKKSSRSNSNASSNHHPATARTDSEARRSIGGQGSTAADPNSSASGAGAAASNTNRASRRRESLKVALKRACSNASSSNVLTDERRQLIQESWKQATDRTGKLEASLSIFQILFSSCPELRYFFNVHAAPLDRLDDCSPFVRHARVFVNVLDLAVRNVFELETEVAPILVMFGRRHRYKHRLSFRNDYLTLFAQSMTAFISTTLAGDCANYQETVCAWRLFSYYIIYKVKEGYDLETMHHHKQPVFEF